MINYYLTRGPITLSGEDSVLKEWRWDNWKFTCKRMKLDPHLKPLAKINLKWIEDLNVRLETMNLEIKLLDMGLGNNLLDLIPKAQATT